MNTRTRRSRDPATRWTIIPAGPPHPSERRDLYHRIRCFPNEVVSWRKRLIRHVEENPDIFPAAAEAGDQMSTLIDEGISFLREIARESLSYFLAGVMVFQQFDDVSLMAA
jgi:hypothetical protein